MNDTKNMTAEEVREVLHHTLSRVTFVAATIDVLSSALSDTDDTTEAQQVGGALVLMKDELDRIGAALDNAWLRFEREKRHPEEVAS